MRNIAGVLVITATISFSAAPFARAQDQNNSSTSSQQGHVQQHQGLLPPSQQKNSESRADRSARDQSAEAPQSPAVIKPPTTGDKSVITPPATGMTKTPVIKPPGAPGNNDDIKPK
jgi:hypothetical protein